MPGGLMSSIIDPVDMTGQFNTTLRPTDEVAFQAWAKQASTDQGRDVLGDLYNYDLRGWWKDGDGRAANGHLTDAYKKPNHPTFSDQSVYSNGANRGGQWTQTPDGSWQYYARHGNSLTPAQLAEYFATVEPGNRAIVGAPLR